MKLYELADQYKFLLEKLYDEETGVVNETALETLKELKDPIETKCINITKLYKSLNADYDAIKKERQLMAKREKAFKNRIDSLKNYLLTNMENCEIKKIECPQFKISLQKNPPSVDAYDKNLIPDEYKKITIDYDIQKMKMEMQNGVVIPGARMIQSNSVRIR